MKIKKINESTISCMLTAQEMTEMGFQIDDLMDNRSKAEEFLRDILDEARRTVNFQTSGEALNVQISVMKDGEINLMISDDKTTAVRSLLSQMKERLLRYEAESQKFLADKSKNIIEIPPLTGANRNPKSDGQEPGTSAKEAEKAPTVDPRAALEKSLNEMLDVKVAVYLDNIDSGIRIAEFLPKSGEMKSDLYSYGDGYVLIARLHETRGELALSIFVLSEYAEILTTDLMQMYHVREHGKRILKGDALSVLRQL